MNRVDIIGNLTADPVVRDAGGKKVCQIRVAVQRGYRNSSGTREADFFTCDAWGKIGETIAQYAHKGQKIAVWGALKNDVWTNDKGEERHSTKIVVEGVEFLAKREQTAARDDDGFTPVDGDALPF